MNSIWGNSISSGTTILTNQTFTMYTSNGVNIDFTGKVVLGKETKNRKRYNPFPLFWNCIPLRKMLCPLFLQFRTPSILLILLDGRWTSYQ